MKDKYGKMPNSKGSSKSSDADSGKMGSNHGKTGGLRQEAGTNQGAMDKPNTKNMYPNGLA